MDSPLIGTNKQNLSVALANASCAITELTTSEDALTYLSQIKQFKELLKAARESQEKARKCLELEARAYIRIAKEFRGAWENLSQREYRIVEWLYGLLDHEIDSIIQDALYGRSIDVQYDEHCACQKIRRSQETAVAIEDEIINEYLSKGTVQVRAGVFLDKMPGAENEAQRRIANSFTADTRIRLINRGAVCIGDGIYCNPETQENINALHSAAIIRIKSIMNDLFSLHELLKQIRDKPTIDTEIFIGQWADQYEKNFSENFIKFLCAENFIQTV